MDDLGVDKLFMEKASVSVKIYNRDRTRLNRDGGKYNVWFWTIN